MNTKQTNILMQNKVFAWIALGAGAILLMPLALQLAIGTGVDGQGFNWQPVDFIVMGAILFGTGFVFVLVTRKINKKYRIAIGLAFLLVFLWLWAELAVGVFTNWES